MSTKEDLKTFLKENICSHITSMAIKPKEGVVVGQKAQYPRAAREVWIRYERRFPIAREVGKLFRHLVTIQLYSAGYDQVRGEVLAAQVEDAAESVIDAYDEQIQLFRNNLVNSSLEWIRVVRGNVVNDVAAAGKRMVEARWIPLSLQLDEWDTGGGS